MLTIDTLAGGCPGANGAMGGWAARVAARRSWRPRCSSSAMAARSTHRAPAAPAAPAARAAAVVAVPAGSSRSRSAALSRRQRPSLRERRTRWWWLVAIDRRWRRLGSDERGVGRRQRQWRRQRRQRRRRRRSKSRGDGDGGDRRQRRRWWRRRRRGRALCSTNVADERHERVAVSESRSSARSSRCRPCHTTCPGRRAPRG